MDLAGGVFAAGIAFACAVAGSDVDAAEAPLPAPAPAPVGVFGVDMPAQDRLVLSLSPSFTRQQGNLIGSRSVTPLEIISTVSSPYTPVGDHPLRMAPQSLSVDSLGIGAAYGLSRDVTVGLSTVVQQRSVHMQTFSGLSGSTSLGYSDGTTTGLGDTTVSAIVKVFQSRTYRLNVNFGLSLPTGGVTETFNLLTPSGTAPTKRAFYALQLGSGTVDAMPGFALIGASGAWSWGVGYRGRLPLDTNGQGWRFGALEEANAWGEYAWAPGLETTLRVNGSTQGRISGDDPQIRGYGQSVDPRFYGGDQISLFGGLIIGGRYFGVNAAQFGLEGGEPVYQRLNGPQLGRAWQLNMALRYRL